MIRVALTEFIALTENTIFYNQLCDTMKQTYNIWHDSLEHTKFYIFQSYTLYISYIT